MVHWYFDIVNLQYGFAYIISNDNMGYTYYIYIYEYPNIIGIIHKYLYINVIFMG